MKVLLYRLFWLCLYRGVDLTSWAFWRLLFVGIKLRGVPNIFVHLHIYMLSFHYRGVRKTSCTGNAAALNNICKKRQTPTAI